MCGCGIGAPCFGGCPCGCKHTGPANVRYYRDRRGFVGMWDPENHDGSARPVVVIDPEDREQVEQLADANERATPDGLVTPTQSTDAMQAALRSLITPPKPPEPTGLGAVVEDADGELWIRWEIPNRHPKPWTVAGSIKPNRAYDELTAVNVLSEGVTA